MNELVVMDSAQKKSALFHDRTVRIDPKTTEITAKRTHNVFDQFGLRPWRMAIHIPECGVELVVELDKPLVIGRRDMKNATAPDIDLQPFGAEKCGVSRQHLVVKLNGDHVIVMDNGSSNGTKLNGMPLPAHSEYPLNNDDTLYLGALEVQVKMLMNPLV
jgi:hypothetical protein